MLRYIRPREGGNDAEKNTLRFFITQIIKELNIVTDEQCVGMSLISLGLSCGFF